jgi:hypothetical protein
MFCSKSTRPQWRCRECHNPRSRRDAARRARTRRRARDARSAANAALAARSRRRTAGRALAAEAVDRPGYFPEATPPLPACPTCADAMVSRSCIVHPPEAGARPPRWSARTFAQRSGLGRARLHGYRRGSARESARPGAAYDGEMLSGTINMLCSQRYTDIGEGVTYQSSWLEIAAWADSARWTRDRVYLCS